MCSFERVVSSAQDIMGHHGISRTATKVDVRFRPELNDPMAVLFIWLTRNHYRSTVQSRGWGRGRSLNLSLPSRRRKRITGSRPRADSGGDDPLLRYVSPLHSSINYANEKKSYSGSQMSLLDMHCQNSPSRNFGGCLLSRVQHG